MTPRSVIKPDKICLRKFGRRETRNFLGQEQMEMTLELKKAMCFSNRFLESLHNEKLNLNLNLSGNLLTVRSGHQPLRTKKYYF